ncbi:MAG TPA: bacterioferritin [Kofleriaceae bacterium]|nr:bacterioferritin [Kofleriaceae bacterium]
MKGHADIITLLNDLLTNELTAINQYFVHSKMCKNWGFNRLAKKIWDESIDEMKHADKVIERILFLEGVPNLQRLNKLRVGETVKEQFESDLAMEMAGVKSLNEWIATAVRLADNTTRELLESILISEEEHIDWLETQLQLVNTLGEANYLSQQLRD